MHMYIMDEDSTYKCRIDAHMLCMRMHAKEATHLGMCTVPVAQQVGEDLGQAIRIASEEREIRGNIVHQRHLVGARVRRMEFRRRAAGKTLSGGAPAEQDFLAYTCMCPTIIFGTCMFECGEKFSGVRDTCECSMCTCAGPER